MDLASLHGTPVARRHSQRTTEPIQLVHRSETSRSARQGRPSNAGRCSLARLKAGDVLRVSPQDRDVDIDDARRRAKLPIGHHAPCAAIPELAFAEARLAVIPEQYEIDPPLEAFQVAVFPEWRVIVSFALSRADGHSKS